MPSFKRSHSPRTSKRRLTHIASAAALLLAFQAALAQTPPAAAQPAVSFNVPAQPLDQALAQFARQAGLQLAASPDLIRGLQGHAIRGMLGVQAALDELLRGSGLVGRIADGLVTIERAVPRAEAETTLPMVRVSAAAVGGPVKGYVAKHSAAATGLDLSMRETPQSVTVMTRERMEDQNTVSLADVAVATPGVSSKSVDSMSDGFFVRGFKVTKLQIDGVPMTWMSSGSSYADRLGQSKDDMTLYERVEVVRGATGLLSGSGSPAASINLVRKHADSRTLAGSVELGLGSSGQRSGMADVSTPLTQDGSVRMRLVASAGRQEAPHVDFGHTDKRVVYGVVDADITPSTRLSVGASEQRSDQRGMPWSGLPIWFSDGTRTDWDRSKHTATPWNRDDTAHRNAFVALNHQLDDRWQLRINATRDQRRSEQRNLWAYGALDRLTGVGLDTWLAGYESRRDQSDLSGQLSGEFDLMGRTHQLSTGISYSRDKKHIAAHDALSSPTIGNFYEWNGNFSEPEWGAAYLGEKGEITQRGAYAVVRWSLTDRLKLISGGRTTRWQRHNEAGAWYPDFRIGHNVFTPYAGLILDVAPSVSAYASYTSIFEPQQERDRSARFLDPLKGKAYEAGLKSELLGGKLQANAAVFRIDQNDLAQVDAGVYVPNSDREQAYYAAKGARTTGYELEMTGSPMTGWNLSLGWTHFRAKAANGDPVNTGFPHKLLKLFAKYRFDEGTLQGLTLGGGVAWENGVYSNLTNPAGGTEKVAQPAYALVNLMSRYEVTQRASIQVNVSNLFDKKYYANDIGYFQNLFYGAPRTVSVALRYGF